MINFFRKKVMKKEIVREESKDICSQLGDIGKYLIAETLRQGVNIIENYSEDEFSAEKVQLICDILGDIFECEQVNYMDILYKLHKIKKENKEDESKKTDEEYLRLFLKLTFEYVGCEDCIKLKAS